MAIPVLIHVLEVEDGIAGSAARVGLILLSGTLALVPGPAIDRLIDREVAPGVAVGLIPAEDVGHQVEDDTVVGAPDNGGAIPLGGVKRTKGLV